jgi:CHAT domain-containing protein/tetratricopeptide (TPR) repeat protein
VRWIVTSCLVLAACTSERETPESPPYTLGHAALIAAVGARRLVEARLSGFPFAPWPGQAAAPSELRDKPYFGRLLAAEAQTKRELATQRSPTTLGAAAVIRLVEGVPGSALDLLDEATATSPGDARLLVDRAAALLDADRSTDLADEVAAMVNRLSSTPPARERPAWNFNRALLFERLGMAKEAAAAFRVAAAPGDDWAEEAAARAAELERSASGLSWEKADRDRLLVAATRGDGAAVAALVDRWPVGASVLVEEDILGALAAQGSESRLLQAELIARALARRGDSFLAETLAALRRRGDTPELVLAHADYARGRSLQRQGHLEEAQALLDQAARVFNRADSPFSGLADLRWAACGYQRGQYRQALDRVRAALERMPPSALETRARLEWLAGLLEIAGGSPAAALDRYHRALELYERASAEEGIATVEMLTAEAWWLLGERREAWRHRRRALRLCPRVSDSERQRTILDEAAEASAGDGLLELAGMLQDRVVESARGAANAFALPVALSQRARVRSRRGDLSSALADLAASRRGLEMLPENAFREHLRIHFLMIEAEILQVSDPVRAIEKLNIASVYYSRMERWVSLRTAELERARCHLQLGNEEAALTDLKLADACGETVRSQGRSERVRATQDEQAQPLYNDLVRLELGRGRMEEAFAYSEKARARRLADSLNAETVSLRSLRSSLPPATALLVYHDLGTRLVAFLIRREGVVAVDLARSGLEAEIASLRRSIEKGADSRWRSSLATLEARLIAPLRPRLGGIETLVIVPHRTLFKLPFGALYDAPRGRYLIQDYRLLVAPSAAVFRAALGRSSVLSGRGGKVLAVAAAVPSPGLSTLLEPLPLAEVEAREVAAAYPGSELLEGDSVTKKRFLEEARRSAVVHFAGHAVASAADPALSFLVLGAPTGAEGALYADEIVSRSWPTTRLVVLSACSTAQGSVPDAEGVQGLARAFLAAGVPAVVGTLWAVEDHAAQEISVRFHREHARGLDPASALRAAQLSLLAEEPASRPAWAAFEVIGGVAEETVH